MVTSSLLTLDLIQQGHKADFLLPDILRCYHWEFTSLFPLFSGSSIYSSLRFEQKKFRTLFQFSACKIYTSFINNK